ncbi:hypothetical protein AALP_AAs60715U000900 [Arabis alpina]|uniref:Uncharacterized protein n=1 Tax=Arabis alpina TaxID=50452 RepID=A0A087G2M1_ARAAL|nr:hypothetical protein AALP_AAs60715U000900 [Arabis alpina]
MPPKPKPKPAVAGKATAAGRLRIVARRKAAAKGRQGAGTSSGGRGDRRRGGGGGIPTLPLLTCAGSGGSTARSDRLVTATRQLVAPGRDTSCGRKYVVEGTSRIGGTQSPSSEKTISGSVSRTSQPAQFPPTRLGLSASQRQNPNLNDLPRSRFQGRSLDMTQEDPEEEDEQEEKEEDYYADFAEENIQMEEEDEVDAPQHLDAAHEDEAP